MSDVVDQAARQPRSGLGWWRAAVWGLGALLCIGVAAYSYRYLAPSGPPSSSVTENGFAQPWLAVHVACAATALLLGPWQFLSTLRQRRPRWHRWSGRVYVAGCMLGGVSGLLLALGSVAGPIAMAGFGLLAVLWLLSTGLAWRAAMQRRFAEHRAWMIRSFALTFAAVTLRLQLPALVIFLPSIEFIDGYRAISFLAWVPNLLVAEWYLRRRLASVVRRPSQHDEGPALGVLKPPR